MAKVRARSDNNLLFMDFYYMGVRCREQTALQDTKANRRRVQALMNRIQKEIEKGMFDYPATFPDSPRTEQFARMAQGKRLGGSARTVPADSGRAADTPVFADFSETWRAEMQPQWRRQHRNSADVIFNSHLLPAFGDKRLADIAKADVLAFRAELAKLPGRGNEHLSPATINKIMGILRQCMTEASERFDLPNTFRGIKRLRGQRPDIHPFSLDEVEQIRSAIRPDYRAYVIVRFFTGMRSGEINGLKWKYIDFDNDLISIRETFSAGVVEENAKTSTSLRDIPMLPMVKEALRQHWEERHPDSEYVFCSRQGNPIDANNFANRVWYPLLRYLDLDKRRPYQTRHTTATLMLASGENPEWIARVMGHANTQMLFTVYSRYVPNVTHHDGLAITGLLSGNGKTGVKAEKPARPQDIDAMSADELRNALAQMLAKNPK